MRLFSNRSQGTSRCGKNISDTRSYASCATFLFLPHFDFICDLSLNRCTATWNLFVKWTTTASGLFVSELWNNKIPLRRVRLIFPIWTWLVIQNHDQNFHKMSQIQYWRGKLRSPSVPRAERFSCRGLVECFNILEGQINKIASCCSCTVYATGNAQSAQLGLSLLDYPNTTIRKRSHYSTSLNSKELSSARPWMEETKTHINRYFTTSVLVQAAAVVRGNSLRGLFNKSCRCCACSCWGK